MTLHGKSLIHTARKNIKIIKKLATSCKGCPNRLATLQDLVELNARTRLEKRFL